MIRVVLLGAGNVATHLINAFLQAKNIDLVQVYSRKTTRLQNFKTIVDTTSNLKQLKEADVYIIAISDDAIAEFSSKLDLKNSLVVHTSGSVALNGLDNTLSRKGVFYPLQTFSATKKIDFTTIPICIEATDNNDLEILKKLASSISKNVFDIDSKQRKNLHLAAVFVNNFANHMYHIGNEICTANNVSFKILQPLIEETAKKVLDLTPYEAQTGPAKRKDTETIAKHLKVLPENQQEIYKLITKSISETYE